MDITFKIYVENNFPCFLRRHLLHNLSLTWHHNFCFMSTLRVCLFSLIDHKFATSFEKKTSADYTAEEQGTKSFNVKEEMSDSIYNDVIGIESEGMQTERVEMTVEIYESVRDHDFRTEINTHQPLQSSGNHIHYFDINITACTCSVI